MLNYLIISSGVVLYAMHYVSGTLKQKLIKHRNPSVVYFLSLDISFAWAKRAIRHIYSFVYYKKPAIQRYTLRFIYLSLRQFSCLNVHFLHWLRGSSSDFWWTILLLIVLELCLLFISSFTSGFGSILYEFVFLLSFLLLFFSLCCW